jgi:hypothetical protein
MAEAGDPRGDSEPRLPVGTSPAPRSFPSLAHHSCAKHGTGWLSTSQDYESQDRVEWSNGSTKYHKTIYLAQDGSGQG